MESNILLASLAMLAMACLATSFGALLTFWPDAFLRVLDFLNPGDYWAKMADWRKDVRNAEYRVGGVLFLAAGLFMFYHLIKDIGADSETIRQRMAAAVPLKSTPAQVLAYLNRQKIDHTQYLQKATAGNAILARIQDRHRWSTVETSYIARFSFDDESHLASIDVRRVYTGP